MPDTAPSDDLAALRQYAQTRDPRAFEVLVLRYQALVYGICRRQLGNPSDAEDATQETFVKLARKAAQVRSGVAGWLHACAVGTCRDLIRRNATRRGHERAFGKENAATDTAPAEGMTWAELGPEVDAAMEALSATDRALIAERFLAGTPQTELAEAAGVSPSAIHQRIDRAILRLRKAMSKRGIAMTGAGLGVVLGQAGAEAATVPAVLTGSLVKVGLAGVGGAPTGSAVGGGLFGKVAAAFQGMGVAGKAAVISAAATGGVGVAAVVIEANHPDDGLAPTVVSAPSHWVESPPIDYAGAPTEAWLDGTWRVVETHINNMPVERLTLEGDTLRSAVTLPGQTDEMYELIMRVVRSDPQAHPAVLVLDVIRCNYPEPNPWRALIGKRIEAIYQVENGVLMAMLFADGEGRPDGFELPASRPVLGWQGFREPGVDQSSLVMDGRFDPLLGGQWQFLPIRYLTFEQGRGTVWVPFAGNGFHQQFEMVGFRPQDHPDGRFRIDTVITHHEQRAMVGQALPILMRFEGPDNLTVTNFEGPMFLQGRVPQGFEIEGNPWQGIGRLIRIR